jgi:hypothetical protein
MTCYKVNQELKFIKNITYELNVIVQYTNLTQPINKKDQLNEYLHGHKKC